MMAVHKFVIGREWVEELDLPKGAKPLSVQIQQGRFCLWALVDTDAEIERRLVQRRGTGFEIENPDSTYLGTVQEDPFVWHFFLYSEVL